MSDQPAMCRLCGKNRLDSAQEQNEGACQTCQSSAGYWRLPPWNRPIRACPGCGSREFVRALAIERAAGGADYVTAYATPLSVAFRRVGRKTLFGQGVVETPEAQVSEQIGWLEMVICRGCGLTSWFALQPGDIPVGPEFGTEILRVPDSDPYR